MDSEELIEHATERIEAMGDAIEGARDLINGIYAERQTALNLLWLSVKEKAKNLKR